MPANDFLQRLDRTPDWKSLERAFQAMDPAAQADVGDEVEQLISAVTFAKENFQ